MAKKFGKLSRTNACASNRGYISRKVGRRKKFKPEEENEEETDLYNYNDNQGGGLSELNGL